MDDELYKCNNTQKKMCYLNNAARVMQKKNMKLEEGVI